MGGYTSYSFSVSMHESHRCNEAVRGDMSLEMLKSQRDRAKLKRWYKLASMPSYRYPISSLTKSGRINLRKESRGNLGVSM